MRQGVAAVVAALTGPALLLLFYGVRYHDPLVAVRAFQSGWHAQVGVDHWRALSSWLASDPPVSEALPALWAIVCALTAALLVVWWLGKEPQPAAVTSTSSAADPRSPTAAAL